MDKPLLLGLDCSNAEAHEVFEITFTDTKETKVFISLEKHEAELVAKYAKQERKK